ncbi:MAG: cytochrome c3 family protein [Planctomycetes bacterium]|nr:cytochrome c3 family protein [Planctomycetota bacterium]
MDRRILSVSFLLCVGAAAVAQQSQCVVCHAKTSPEIVEQHRRSVHADATNCVGCHGGDPAAATTEGGHAATRGFRAKFSQVDAAKLCASCHSDVAAMKAHALDARVDAEWAASTHGKLCAAGDTRAPSCVTCHGSHEILSRSDSKSPTHRSHVPGECAKCHADPAKMGDSKLPTDQLTEYLAGAHGKLFTSTDPARRELAPTCVDCHGAHGAKPPDAQSVAGVCKDCHFEAQRYLSTGVHQASLRQTGAPSCVNCHDNHRTTLGSGIEATCSQCHEQADDPAHDVVTRLASIVEGAQAKIRHLDELLAAHTDKESTRGRLLEAERRRIDQLHRNMLDVAHSLHMEDLSVAVRELERSIDTVEAISETELEESNGFSTPMIVAIMATMGVVLVILSLVVAKLLARLARAESSPSRERSA